MMDIEREKSSRSGRIHSDPLRDEPGSPAETSEVFRMG